jgi:hypothetical protein
VTPGPLGEAMTRFAANPQDEALLRESRRCRRNRQDTHDVRRDDAPRRSCFERLAADGDCDVELSHLPRYERR